MCRGGAAVATRRRSRHPGSWLIGAAHHKALDWMRRESRRSAKEREAACSALDSPDLPESGHLGDDQLALIFACCHPALDPGVRVPLTLRAVCGLRTAQIAAAFLIAEPTMAERLVRAKRKIRDAGIPLRVPGPEMLPDRLANVLQVVYVMFTEGHHAFRGSGLTRPDLCEEAISLARRLRLLIDQEAEVDGLLALLLLTDARRAARTDQLGDVVLLGDQDRRLWNHTLIQEGLVLLEAALGKRQPGQYQLQAAIAACHASAEDFASTDWTQIAALYDRLLIEQPSPVVAANRAVAVAMSDGPAAGLAILDELDNREETRHWAPLHIARAELLSRVGRRAERRALSLRSACHTRHTARKSSAESSLSGRSAKSRVAIAGVNRS